MINKPQNLALLLEKAQAEGYAVGSFNCRYWPMIQAVLDAAQACSSPVCIQISQREIEWFGIKVENFVAEVFRVVEQHGITIPYAIHLDHSWDYPLFQQVIASGFTSVMIDASSHPFEENVRLTRNIVELAHPCGVSVEAELGKIASADKLETDSDCELYTDPEEAGQFVAATGCDLLAVSIGSAHGVYQVKDPKIDFPRLAEIRARVSVPLVLHGGTGIPEDTVRQAVALPGGGISKLNIATELELKLLESLGRKERMSPEAIQALTDEEVAAIRDSLHPLLVEKMRSFLGSAGRA